MAVTIRAPSKSTARSPPMLTDRSRILDWMSLLPQLLHDFEQLDVEHQHARRLARAVVVGELDRNPETGLLTLDHELHALGPAGNDAVEREHRGLAAHDRAVEHF